MMEGNRRWCQVIEYASHGLFEAVMSREMEVGEINCCFKQILAGVEFLHKKWFAHRDLKLENVIISVEGIMKIIDFGSAAMCKDTDGKGASLATGKQMKPPIGLFMLLRKCS
jgi:serine/threonine protein kinase